jgi:hypothetical protein
VEKRRRRQNRRRISDISDVQVNLKGRSRSVIRRKDGAGPAPENSPGALFHRCEDPGIPSGLLLQNDHQKGGGPHHGRPNLVRRWNRGPKSDCPPKNRIMKAVLMTGTSGPPASLVAYGLWWIGPRSFWDPWLIVPFLSISVCLSLLHGHVEGRSPRRQVIPYRLCA